MTHQPAEVDEADVAQLLDAFNKSLQTDPSGTLTAEARADAAKSFALNQARARGMSDEWGKELARKVHQRALWKAPSRE
jgi:hypothetical protein